MNNPDSTTHKPRTAAEIAQELTVLTKALEEKKSIEEIWNTYYIEMTYFEFLWIEISQYLFFWDKLFFFIIYESF